MKTWAAFRKEFFAAGSYFSEICQEFGLVMLGFPLEIATLGFPLEISWKCCRLSRFKMLKKMSLALKSYIRLTNLFISDFFFYLPICHCHCTSYSIGTKGHSFLHFCSLGFLHNKYNFTWGGALFIQCFPGDQLGLNYLYLLVTSTRCKMLDGLCVRVNVVCTWQK